MVVFLVAAEPLLEAQVPVINSAGNATAQVTVPFIYRITATNDPTSYSIISAVPSSLVQSLYRGAFGSQTTASGKIWMSGSGQEFPNGSAFAAITSNGSVVAWGNPDAGGNATVVTSSLTSNITAIFSNSQAFAALKSNGSVFAWGNTFSGGSTSGVVGGSVTSGVISISSTANAFAALKNDGSVVTWGNPDSGGNSTIRVGGSLTSNVTAVFSNSGAFAALKSNGSVVTWGDPQSGGNSTIYGFAGGGVPVENSVASQLVSGVVSISATRTAFAARKANGSVVTWGDSEWGGNSTALVSSLSSNVTAIYSNEAAFAALKSNGSVVTWGDSASGGDSSNPVGGNLSSNVTTIYSTPNAFAALKSNGSVVTWGGAFFGGDSSSPTGGDLASGVKTISSTQTAFAALKNNGSVITWGDIISGGNSSIFTPAAIVGDAPTVTSVAASLTSNVTAVFATQSAFAALKSDGSVVTWGFADLGGDSSSVSASLTSNVTAIASNLGTFVALKRDGSIVTWGSSAPGDIPAPAKIGAPAADITSLTGLIFNSANGSLTGSPTKSGNFSFRLGATNSSGTGNAPFSLLILPAPGMSLSGNLSFGNVFVGQNATRNFSITNPASGPLTLTAITSSNSPLFALVGNSSNFTIAPGASQNVTVRFQPSVAGNFSSNITVASNAGDSILSASGTGIAAGPQITLTGDLFFGNVTVNQTANRTLSIKNNTFGNVTFSVPTFPAWLKANVAGNFTLSGNGTRDLTFSFRPVEEQSYSANITISSGLGNSTISASGYGIQTRIISLSGNLVFGNATVNSTLTRNLTISNTGSGNLTVTGISYPQGFSGNWNGTIAPNSTRNVTVSFRPTSEGPFSGTITVNSTATSGNNTFSASGTGIHSRIIGLSGDFAFGSALANRTLDKNPTRLLTISNSGTGNLTVTRIERPAGFRVFASLPDPTLGGNYTTVNFTSSGNSVSLAELTGNFTLPIATGSSKSLLVAFSPTAAASYSGNITVASNASNAAGNSTRAASGTGVASLLSITGNLSFGNVTVNQQAQRTLSITNLDSESHALSFAIATGFSVAFSPFPYDVMGNPVTLEAGATVNATVTFSPTSVQAYSGNFSITSATLGNRTIPTTGTATHSRIIGLTGNLSFGSVWVNATANRTLSIRNTGTGPLNVTGISYPPGFSGNFTGTIAANATQNVTVSFRPTSESPITGNITVTSNATSGTPTIVASGSGVHSRIIGLSGNLSFGSVGVNATANRTLSISNTGTGPLAITGISYPTGFSGNFSGSINPNTTQNVTVSFRPTTAGNFTGNITVNSTATSGNATIAASATGGFLPAITTTNLHGTKGLSFSQRILATNNATTYGNATALPLGLTLNRTTGLISGTMPVGPLTFFSVNITATNSFGTTTAPVTFWFWDDLLSVTGGTLKTTNSLNGTAVSNFRIDKYELSWFEWKAVRDWAVANGYTDLAGVGAGLGELHPVTDVNWFDALKWCNAKSERDGLTPVYMSNGTVYRTGQSVPTVNSAAKGYRLPTEAEWEWAARGGVKSKGYTYSGSNDVNEVAWYDMNSGGASKARGTKAANELGIFDMSGNVDEWCWDQGALEVSRIRGGHWMGFAIYCTVDYHNGNFGPQKMSYNFFGFRLVRNAGN